MDRNIRQDYGHGISFEPARPEPVQFFDVTERAELAVQTYKTLGLVDDAAQATEYFTEELTALHDSLSVQDHGTYGVEPYIALPVTRVFGVSELITAFDNGGERSSSVTPDLLDQYSPRDLNERDIIHGVIDSTMRARAMDLRADHMHEGGLQYVGETMNQQLEHVDGEELITIPDYVVMNAQRREEGRPLLDEDMQTRTRFLQLSPRPVDGTNLYPIASASEGRIVIPPFSSTAGFQNTGVRISVAAPKQ